MQFHIAGIIFLVPLIVNKNIIEDEMKNIFLHVPWDPSLFPWKSAQNRFSSILVVKKIWKWGIVGNLILNNFIICNIWPKYVFTCQEIKEILGKCPKLSKNVQFYCRYLFFNFAFFSVFFGFQLPLETFWLPYRASFLIFCPIWHENSLFCVAHFC